MMDYTLFGESHGSVIGVLIRNMPAGLPADDTLIAADLLRRAPRDATATARRETDTVEYLSGVFRGVTTGMPLVAVLRNRDVKSSDYDALADTPRPGHADYAAYKQADGHNDYRGGGHFSGRLTAALTVAGGFAKTYLQTCGVTVCAEVVDEQALRRRAAQAQAQGDSVGGQIACRIDGLPAGLGGADTAGLESELSRHLFAVPGVKALAFGAGERFAQMRGSEGNDPLRTDGTAVYMLSNHAGGINGGLSNGMPLTFTVTFRPTPSIAKTQKSIRLSTMENTDLCIHGRHDACIALRAAPAIEAAAALGLCQLLQPQENSLRALRSELDVLDSELVRLLEKRLQISAEIGRVKQAEGLSVLDEARQSAVLASRGDLLPERRCEVETLFRTLMALSRREQER